MKYPNLTKHGILVNFWLKLIYATIAKPSSETTQNREKEFSHYSSRKEGIEKHDKEASWNLSVSGVVISFFVHSTTDIDEDFSHAQ
jgi:hypothetical protein